ncbi:MAG: hypothetical protein MNPFHGCM_01690 [Gemmatimonadaceae bacterium]|nr:hypothetical protein [Gemmatimonadaceae bacterium]
MRIRSYMLMGSLSLLSLACQERTPATTALTDDLKRDLDVAASDEGIQLASKLGDFRRQQFVSEIEQSDRPEPKRNVQRPRPIVQARVGTSVENASTPNDPASQEVMAPNPPEPQSAAEVPVADDVPRIPVVAPRPAAAPVEAQGPLADGPGGRTAGVPEIGDVIGVIMRGGRSGDDHCIPTRRPGGRGFPFPRILDPARGNVPIVRLNRN